RKAVKELRHLQRGLVRFLVDRQISDLLRLGDRLDKITGCRVRDLLGEPTHLVVRHSKNLGDLSKGAAGLKGREATDNSRVCGTVAVKDQVDDIVLSVVGKIEINVRKFVQCHPVLVQEAAEVEIETDGTDITDPEAIADQ